MAKYGDFVYGSGTKYGTGDAVATAALTGKIAWIFQVDWNNDGVLDGVNEAANMKDMPSFYRGRSYYISSGGDGFEAFQEGRVSIVLENTSRRYDPWYTSSPLYPNVVPSRKCQLSVNIIDTGEVKIQFTGYIEDIRPSNDGSNSVTIDMVDGFRYLNGYDISTTTPQYHTTISDSINTTLNLAGWQAGSSIDTDTQPLVIFALDNEDAGSTIKELSDASLGNFFIDKTGKATFYSRSHNSQTTHTIDQTQCLDSIPTAQPWENVKNAISVTAIKPFKGALTNILSISPIKINIPVNRVVTFKFDGDWIDVQYLGIEASTQPGGGMDITSAVVVSYTIGKSSATFTFDTAIEGYVNSIRLMGRKLEPKEVSFRASDTTSRLAYKSRRFTLKSEYLQNINHAEAFSTIILADLKDPSKAPVITIEGREDIQFDFELLDKVDFTSATLDIDDTFYIGAIEHRLVSKNGDSGTGQAVQTTLHLQPLIYDATSIDDDPYDPGLPEIPEIPGSGGGNLPPPVEILLDCINDEHAAQNGPFTIFSNSNIEILSTTTLQQQFDIPFNCVVRMGTSDYPTYLTLYAIRTFYFEGAWYQTNNDAFYEVWAIDSVGSPLFQADEVVTQGDYITATFHPSVGTIVAGFRVKLIAGTIYDFDIGYTFDYYGGSQGWIPAPQNASYPLGDIYLPASTRPAWDTRYWDWTTGKLVLTPNSTQDYYATDAQNVWAFYPLTKVYGKADATMSGTVTNVYDSTGFVAIGILFTDNSWDYAEGPGLKTATISGANVGKQVKAFQWHVGTKDPSGDGTWYLDNVTIQGWTTTPASSFKLTIKAASISNICAIP